MRLRRSSVGSRQVAVIVTVALVASLLGGVIGSAVVPELAAATTFPVTPQGNVNPTLCSGDQISSASGGFFGGGIKVPAGDRLKTDGVINFGSWFGGPGQIALFAASASDGQAHILHGIANGQDNPGLNIGSDIEGPWPGGITLSGITTSPPSGRLEWGPDGPKGVNSSTWTFTIIDANGNAIDDTRPCRAARDAREGICNTSEQQASKSHSSCGDPVDTQTGDFHQDFTDDATSGHGALALTRSYDSLWATTDPTSGQAAPFGPGWSFSYGMHLILNKPTTGDVTVSQENGSQTPFFNLATSGAPSFESPPRVDATLALSGSTYTFVRRGTDTFTFDSSGNLLTHTDRYGYTTTVTYSGGRVASIADASSHTLTFGWVGTHIATATDNASPPRVTSYFYNNANNDLTDVTDVAGNQWHFTYGGGHRMLTARTPNQVVAGTPKDLTNTYDAGGRVTRQVDQLGRQTDISYTSVVGSTLVTLPQMSTTDTRRFQRLDTYDPTTSARTAVTLGYGTGNPNLTWHFTVDPSTYGVTSVTDPTNNIVQTTAYDSRGNVWWQTDALNRTTTVADFNAFNEPNYITDPAGVSTRIWYEADGDLNQTTVIGVDETTRYYYDGQPGDLSRVIDARNNTWTATYNTAGVRTSITTPATTQTPGGSKTSWTFDNVGRPQTMVAPSGNVAGVSPATVASFTTTYATDRYGAVTSATDGSGRTTARHFDRDHNQDWTQDPNQYAAGTKNLYAFDAADQLTTVTRPDTTTLQSTFFGDGSLQSQIDGSGNATSYVYDPVQRLTSITTPPTSTAPSGEKTTYGYDADNRLTSKASPGGSCTGTISSCTTYGYDLASQLTSIAYSSNNPPSVSSITYDLDGRRQTMVSSAGTSTWSWDTQGRLTSTTTPHGGTVNYGWDQNSNLTSIAYPGGSCTSTPTTFCVQRTYNEANQLTQIADWAGTATQFSVDPNGNGTGVTFPSASANADSYGFNNTDAMSSATFKQSGTTTASLTYGRDNANQLTSATQTGLPNPASETYGYNSLNQLCWTSPSGGTGTCAAPPGDARTYSYDHADNLTKTGSGVTQGYDPANQLCWSSPSGAAGTCTTPPADAVNYTNDIKGERTAATPQYGRPKLYTYDQNGELTSTYQPQSNQNSGEYTPVTAARLLDTRSGTQTGTCAEGCTTLAPGQTRTLTVGGVAGIPTSGAQAVGVTVTVQNPTGTGYVTAYPADQTLIAVSTVNYSTAGAIANSAIVKLSADGKIKLTNSSATASVDLTVDAAGWYATPTGQAGDTFTVLTPARALDTRSGSTVGTCTSTCATIPAGGTLAVKLAGAAGIPTSGISAVAANVTVTNTAAKGSAVVYASNATQPVTNSISWQAGQTIAALATPTVGADGYIKITNTSTGSVDVMVDAEGWWATNATPTGWVLTPVNQATVESTTTPTTGTCSPSPCTSWSTTAGTEDVKIAGLGGVPSTANGAVAVTFTVTNHSTTATEAVTAWAGGTTSTQPATDTLEVPPGATVSNSAIVPLTPWLAALQGYINVNTTTASEVKIDVTGYFGGADTPWTYGYDADGLRANKTALFVPTYYSWDKSGGLPQLLQETNSNTHVAISYIYGPDGLPFEQITTNGSTNTPLYYHHDQLGSIRAVTNSTGATVATYTYDAFGQQTGHTGTVSVSFGFAGGYTDPETGFVYLINRYYDPATGTFLTRDPIAPLTRQPYSYAGNNPVTFVDPSGLFLEDPWGSTTRWFRDPHHLIVAAAFVGGVALAATGVGAVVEAGVAADLALGTEGALAGSEALLAGDAAGAAAWDAGSVLLENAWSAGGIPQAAGAIGNTLSVASTTLSALGAYQTCSGSGLSRSCAWSLGLVIAGGLGSGAGFFTTGGKAVGVSVGGFGIDLAGFICL